LAANFVEVIRLRIELGRETLDIVRRNLNLFAFEAHAEAEIIKPFDHVRLPLDRPRSPRCSGTFRIRRQRRQRAPRQPGATLP
jgi:hypothetical protein